MAVTAKTRNAAQRSRSKQRRPKDGVVGPGKKGRNLFPTLLEQGTCALPLVPE